MGARVSLRHTQLPKANDHVRALRCWLRENPDATGHDRAVAGAELDRLLDALGRPDGAEEDDEHPDPRVCLPLVRALVDAGPPTIALVREHTEQFDEVLPTVLLADLARRYVAAATDLDDGRAAQQVVVTLDRLFRRGDDTMRAVIATGFLEGLPRRDEPGHGVLADLPRRLRRELAATERA
jgi:hypothetical protein